VTDSEFQTAALELLARIGERVENIAYDVEQLRSEVAAIPTIPPDLSDIELALADIGETLATIAPDE